MLVAIPTVIVAGPLFSKLAARWADVPVPDLFVSKEEEKDAPARLRPSFAIALVGILLPVVLMLARSVREAALPTRPARGSSLLDFLGTPMVALTVAVLYAMVFFAPGGGMDRRPSRSRSAPRCPTSRASCSSSAPAAGSSRCSSTRASAP